MISKMINPKHISALKIDSKDAEIPEWNKRIQRVAGYLSGKPILCRLDFLDDLKMFPIKEALEYSIDRWLRIITFRHFRQQICNGWAYFKKGYNSYNFDSAFALDMFLFNLENLAKVLEENDRHLGDRQQAKVIREVIRLMNRVMEDDYVEEFEAKVSEKYGDRIRYVASTEGLWGFVNKGKGPFKDGRIAKTTIYKRENETYENYKDIHKAERAMYRKADAKRRREWKKALGIIEKHFFEWWD